MKVCEIFDLIQESSAAHLKHATMLTQIFTRVRFLCTPLPSEITKFLG